MKIKKIIVLLLLIIPILFSKKNFVVAQSSKIFINEFLIEPQQQVEIINIGSESANLKNWLIDDDGSSSSIYQINNDAIIYPNSCLVFSSNFYLNTKSSDTIRLFDDKNNLIDSYFYKSNPGANISYQRLPDSENNWATAEATLGFFNLTKAPCIISPTSTPSPIPTPTFIITSTTQPTVFPTNPPTITPSPTSSPISFDNIFISEAMVYPNEKENEWVEIFNNNDFSVDLINWYLDDIENAGSSPKSFTLNIPAKSYKSVILSTSIFNNSGDSIRLLDFNKNLKDSFEYNFSKQNKTWGRIDFDEDNFCIQESSFEQKNNPCIIINNTNIKSSSNQKNNLILSSITPKTIINNSIKKITNFNSLLKDNEQEKNNQSQVLGINTSFKNKTKNLILFFSLNSFFYSLLTVIFILIKINLKYGKIKKLFLSLIYTQ